MQKGIDWQVIKTYDGHKKDERLFHSHDPKHLKETDLSKNVTVLVNKTQLR